MYKPFKDNSVNCFVTNLIVDLLFSVGADLPKWTTPATHLVAKPKPNTMSLYKETHLSHNVFLCNRIKQQCTKS